MMWVDIEHFVVVSSGEMMGGCKGCMEKVDVLLRQIFLQRSLDNRGYCSPHKQCDDE